MTRESKLALIVGFGLILFVGILVSDHFSSGQRQESAHLLAQRGALRGAAAPVSIQPTTAAPIVQQARNPIDQGTALPVPAVPGPRVPPHLGQGQTPGSGEGALPQGTPEERETARQENDPTRNGAGSAGAEFTLYPVKDGETIYSICVAKYGDGSLWQALATFNQSIVPKPSRMRKGVTLRLPPVEVLRGGSVATVPATGGTPPSGAEERPAVPPVDRASSPMATVTVKRGDTLTAIAERTLRDKARWKELADMNADVVLNPHALVPGTVLRVPSQG